VTPCLEGTVLVSRRVAWCRPMSYLAAQMQAGCGPASPGGCGRWLPVWLPALRDSTLVRTSENAPTAPHACGGVRWGRVSPACQAAKTNLVRAQPPRPPRLRLRLWPHRRPGNPQLGRRSPRDDERGASASRAAAGRAPPRPSTARQGHSDGSATSSRGARLDGRKGRPPWRDRGSLGPIRWPAPGRVYAPQKLLRACTRHHPRLESARRQRLSSIDRAHRDPKALAR
jgi:hypothetical protein